MGVSPVGLVITGVSPVGLVVSWVGELAVTEGDKLCLSIVILLPEELSGLNYNAFIADI